MKLSQWIILISAAVLMGLFLFISPITSAPDELAHLAYPRTMLQSGTLPAFTSAFDPWESHQPPLYYLLSVPVSAVFSETPFEMQVIAARAVSFLLVLLYIFLIFQIADYSFPDFPMAKKGMYVLSLLPSVLYTGASFTNDSLVLCMSAIFLLYAVKYTHTTSAKYSLLFGLLIGAGLLTKFSLYPIIAVITLWVYWKKPWKFIFTSSLVALISSGWWFIHNVRVVGDIFGLRHTFILWAGQKPIWTLESIGIFIIKMYASTIGIFGKLSIPLPFLLYAVWIVSFAILLGFSFKKPIERNIQLAWISITAMLIFICIQSSSFYQPQGRYFFAAFPFVALIFAKAFSNARLHIFRTHFFYAICLLLTCSSIVGIFLVHSYYKKNPVTQFSAKRTIDFMHIPWKGDASKIFKDDATFTVTPPFNVYTIADLRIATERKPIVHINSQTSDSRCIIRYKRLGDSDFISKREFTLQLQNGIVEVPFPDMAPTLIQDISFSCEKNDNSTPMRILDFQILTQ